MNISRKSASFVDMSLDETSKVRIKYLSDRLRMKDILLACLSEAGLAEWKGYDVAMTEYRKRIEELNILVEGEVNDFK